MELQAILTHLSPAELQERVLRHARQLPAAERRTFLNIFSQTTSPQKAPTESLLEEIGEWVERLEAGHYYQGYGWDHELGYERAWGDESWAEEADDLFTRADAAFLAGERSLACKAYELLLEAFLLDDEGIFCGPSPPQEMVVADLAEAKARYFRALFETTSAAERADLLLDAMNTLQWVGPHVGLGEVLQADSAPLADFEEFLPLWLEVLRQEDTPQHQSETMVRKLLVEAVLLSQGTDGLREVARERGEYLAWVEALAGEGRRADAIAAALEGVAHVCHAHARGLLGEALARLATAQGDAELLLKARRIEWRAGPSPARLVHLCQAAEAAGSLKVILTQETSDYRAGQLPLSASLACQLLLLTRDYHEVLELFQQGKALGWSNSDHPGMIVLPFLLLAGSKAFSPLPGTWLSQLWNALDTGFRGFLVAACHRQPPEPEEADRFLSVARTAIEQRVHSIVSNKHRGAYDRAARLAAAYAEATSLYERSPEGWGLLQSVRSAFPRHYAFQDALDGAVQSSPLLRGRIAEKRRGTRQALGAGNAGFA
ncbi:MAG TPA: hypothetical protein VD969_10045 [Symbiobacteriaceae bacterium]|nr:hypothetical protein [Symbiobacteriaceae bacterium]